MISVDTTEQTVPVGEQVLGRVLNGRGEPIDGGPPLRNVLHIPLNQEPRFAHPPAADSEMLHTGIKVVDLFAPLVRGGVAEVIAGVGVGKLVLLAELIETTARRGGHTICLGLEARAHTTNGLMLEMRSMGVDHKLAMVFAQRDNEQTNHKQVIAAGFTMAEYFRNQGEDVVLLADRQLLQHQLDQLRSRIGTTANGAITAIVFDMVHDEEPPTNPADVDSRLVFSTALAKQGLYPAIDPIRSASRFLNGQNVAEKHVAVAQQARDLLQRYAALHDVAEAGDVDAFTGNERIVALRARRVQRFLTQPFVVAEPWTGQPGEQVPIADTIAGVQAILAGHYDDVPEQALYFIGSIGQAGWKTNT